MEICVQVIFSDEKKFNLDGPDGFNGYWRDLRKEPLYFSRRNFGGGSLMVWGAISEDKPLEIQFTSTRMNSEDYITVLRSSLINFLKENRQKQWIFQQDNAAIHTSRQTMAWFKANSIQLLAWPACSPDLNPMENTWGILVRRVYADQRQFSAVEELKHAIIEEWGKLDSQLLKKLILSMSKRIFDIVKAKGSQIKY